MKRIIKSSTSQTNTYYWDGIENVPKDVVTVVVEDGVSSISDWAFCKCGSLVSIQLPDTVTSIGDYAFQECKNLKSINIPENVRTIGFCAFDHCMSLTSIVIPHKVETIGGCAFRGCANLESIEIPDTVTSIGKSAFYWCTKLKSIVLPNKMTDINEWTFRNCDSLISLTIPDSVKHIREGAFWGCDNLTVKCDEDSYAYSYAKQERIPIQTLDGRPAFSPEEDNYENEHEPESADYLTAIKEWIQDNEAAEIIYKWYNNEDAFEEFGSADSFIEYLAGDIYDMVDAAQGHERTVVEKALGYN